MTCAKGLVTATLTAMDGRVFVGRNDCGSPQPACPRGDLPSGVGYEMCRDICRQFGHAETVALRLAGDAAFGSTVVVSGHNYICLSCQREMIRAGVAFFRIDND